MNREIIVWGQTMYKANVFKRFIPALLLMLASLGMMTDASATTQIYASAKGKGIKVTSCQSCHTGASGSESKGNLKPGYQAAYNLDKVGLTRLKNKINGCPVGQALNQTTFLCVPAITKAGTVGLAGSGLAKTDVYAVTCGTGTAALWVSVKDLAPVKLPLVSIQAKKGAVSSPLSTDAGVDGNALYSPLVKVAGVAGAFTVNVNKSAYTGTLAAHKGAESYTALFSCRKADGTQVGTTPVLKQNQ
jgi:hypothetical protein